MFTYKWIQDICSLLVILVMKCQHQGNLHNRRLLGFIIQKTQESMMATGMENELNQEADKDQWNDAHLCSIKSWVQ